MTSLNHYALGAVADWLHRVVGGLQRLEAGWRRLRIAPQPGGGLTWARVAHDTVHGRVSCEWRIADGRMRVDVRVPAGTSATVVLPVDPAERTEEVGPGDHSWEYDLPSGFGVASALTLDSSLRDVHSDAVVGPPVADLLVHYFPDVSVDAALNLLGDSPLSDVVAFVPDQAPQLERELRTILDRHQVQP